jgi:hypothetical protein
MDDYTPPAPNPSAGMSAADCQELAQRRAEERNAMKAKIAALEQADKEKNDRIAALEAKLASSSSNPGSDDDDDTTPPKNRKSPNGGSVTPKAPPSQDAPPKATKRFL